MALTRAFGRIPALTRSHRLINCTVRCAAAGWRPIHYVHAVACAPTTPPNPDDVACVYERAHLFGEEIATYDTTSQSATYSQLIQRAEALAMELLEAVLMPDLGEHPPERKRGRGRGRKQRKAADTKKVDEARREFLKTATLDGRAVAFLCDPGHTYVVAQWAIWMAGGVAVPMCIAHPMVELEYVITDSNAVAIVVDMGQSIKGVELVTSELEEPVALVTVVEDGLPHWAANRRLPPRAPVDADAPATIMYTSGTTARPKGVVTTHKALRTQITDLVKAWEWKPEDRILHFLPLHHVHGMVNKLLCALWVGARVHFVHYDPARVLKRIARGDMTVFMAVPTIYVQLIEEYEALSDEEQAAVRAGAAKCRLMVSGSAPLPVSVLESWQRITGHLLLERYGMTEFGMALSNPLDPAGRRPGCVGLPLPSVEVKVVSTDDSGVEEVVSPPDDRHGELRVKGDTVFTEYIGRPESTKTSFDEEGYFKTGDIVQWRQEDGAYAVIGRESVDIIKTGAHKVGALEVERALLERGDLVAEVAVLGVSDGKWGQIIVAAVRLRDGAVSARGRSQQDCRDALIAHCERVLSPEKIPRHFAFAEQLPKNAMGKVNKKEMSEVLAKALASADEA